MKAEVIKFALLKKQNKRIRILILKYEDGTFGITIETKRLVDFKLRQILIADIVYGLESFVVIKGIFDMIMEEPEFLKMANKELGQIMKGKFKCNTNFIRQRE